MAKHYIVLEVVAYSYCLIACASWRRLDYHTLSGQVVDTGIGPVDGGGGGDRGCGTGPRGFPP